MTEIVTRVLGVNNLNEDGKSRQKILSQYGAKKKTVTLRHLVRPDCDPNTIEVLIAGDEEGSLHRIGFLPGRIGSKLARIIDGPDEVTAVINRFGVGEGDKNIDIALKINY